MMNPMDMNRPAPPRRASVLAPVMIGCGAFAVGAVLTFGYFQWKSQQNQLALMTQMIQQMGQNQQQVGTATRAAAPDLLTVATPAPAATLASATPAAAPAPAPAVQASVAAPTPAPAEAATTADRIRALVSRSSDPLVSAALAQDNARRDTMSVAIQGVNELAAAAVEGNYALTFNNEAGNSGRLGIIFQGHEEDQQQLEKLLASAAQAGMIAFHESVRSSDGSYNGDIILYDLIERALVHGTPEERRTGEAIRQQALTLLGANKVVDTTPVNTAGERFYTVEPGDSLAYIALRYYGNTNDYQKIFQANRDVLSSPEKIQIGQQLLIPEA